MKKVFVDSGGWYAHLVSEDVDHMAALRLFQRAKAEGWFLVTSNAVVFETHALLLNRARDGRTVALGFLDDVEAGMCRVERVTKADEARAIGLIRAHSDKMYSLCDALSFVVIERLGIDSVIAFDAHFRQYGRYAVL
ncbi:MAG: type II toxin-antitoxin system VapC family toxin [Deltaproteobacteria bacterium]|nr:type II toxin-antitoxin system VapC family toxin [Deltaproteobacteria bacterium]